MSERSLPFSLEEFDKALREYQATPDGYFALEENQRRRVVAGALAALSLSRPTAPEFRIKHTKNSSCGGVVWGRLDTGAGKLEFECQNCKQDVEISL
jgi:hypothetical protein